MQEKDFSFPPEARRGPEFRGPQRPPQEPTQTTGASGGEPVLRVEDLHKNYKSVKALNGVSIEVSKGEVVGFLGPNGAGKTTFTKCVLGFLRPDRGTVELFGQRLDGDNRHLLARVGLVPDQYDFYGTLTGVQHLEFYGELYGLKGTHLRSRIGEVLSKVGMTERAQRRVRTYSHGMKQRLCIAQALLNNPEFIIFDEPTNGLDPRGAYEMREMIRHLSDQGVTIFLSSHILSEVEQVCNRVAIISQGRILVQSDVAELRKKISGGQVKVTVTLADPDPALERLLVDSGVARKATLTNGRLACVLAPGVEVHELVQELARTGARIQGVEEETIGLEQIFLQLTEGEGGL